MVSLRVKIPAEHGAARKKKNRKTNRFIGKSSKKHFLVNCFPVPFTTIFTVLTITTKIGVVCGFYGNSGITDFFELFFKQQANRILSASHPYEESTHGEDFRSEGAGRLSLRRAGC